MGIENLNRFAFQNPYIASTSEQVKQGAKNPFVAEPAIKPTVIQTPTTKQAQKPTKDSYLAKFQNGEMTLAQAMEFLNDINSKINEADFKEFEEDKFADNEFLKLQNQNKGNGELTPYIAGSPDRILNSNMYKLNPQGLFA